MHLVRFDPHSLINEFDRWFDRDRTLRWAPRLDTFDRDTDLVVRVEVPGVDPDTIEVTVENSVLTISGARRFDESAEEGGYHRREIFAGEFSRSLALPKGLDADGISARANHGLLEIVVPRLPEVLPRKVKVETSA